jgi:cytochrome c-type biogenesis protein
MAATQVFHRQGSRAFWYAAFGALALLPVLAFAIGPLRSDSFSLDGPAGPFLAFSAGVLSFVSPCVLPIVPIYIAHLSGAAVERGQVKTDRRKTFSHGLAFVGGLSLVFIVLGTSVGLLGSYFLVDNQRDLEQIAGVVLVSMGVLLIPSRGRRSPLTALAVFAVLLIAFLFLRDVAQIRGDRTRELLLAGVFVLVWLRFAGYLQLPFVNSTWAFNTGGPAKKVGYTRSAVVGGAFALGWTPCIGPVLGSILTLAATSSEALTGTYLLVAYSAGFSVPFLITALALTDVSRFLKRIQRHAGYIEVVSAVMIVGVGVLLITGSLTGLNEYFGFAEFNQGL